MNNKIKHLEMIQNIISRLSTHSFALKSLAVTLLAALISTVSILSDKIESSNFRLIIIFIPIIFYILDSYYLWKERQFRTLYDSVRLKNNNAIDFCMEISPIDRKKISFFECLTSSSEMFFYLPIWIMLFMTFFNSSIIKICQKLISL